jgi:hypothetical protein
MSIEVLTTKHFKDRVVQRFNANPNEKLAKEVVIRIKYGDYKWKRKTDKKGVYKYFLYATGELKGMLNYKVDYVIVVYDEKNGQLITIAEDGM